MKKFFAVAAIFMSIAANAQTVNIPDSNFKFYLLHPQFGTPVIDINHDGEIQEGEADVVQNLWIRIDTLQIRDITGIKSFHNLKLFRIEGSLVNNYDLSGMTSLTTVGITPYEHILSVNMNGCTHLDTFWCANVGNSIDLRGCPNIRFLDIGGIVDNNLNLQLGSMDNLSFLRFEEYRKDTLDLRSYKNIDTVQCWFTGTNSFLKQVFYASGLTRLKYLSTLEDNLKEMYLDSCVSLERISISTGYKVQKLDVTNCTSLKYLDILAITKIQSLDLSTCPKLDYLEFAGDSLKRLNLKNGSMLSYMRIFHSYVQDTLYVCVDDFENDQVMAALNPDILHSPVVTSPYCNFFPGGFYNTIKGTLHVDVNNNGCDNNDPGVATIPISLSDTAGHTTIHYSYVQGRYDFYPFKGIYTVSPFFAYPYFTISPSTAQVSFDTANSLIETRDFCISPNGVHNDLSITLLPSGTPARPGFNAAYTLTYKNRGTTTLSGNVSVTFDNSKMNFVAATENVSSQSAGQLVWNYSNLQPFETRAINITFNLLPPPVNNIGDTIVYLAAITPSANDETAFDNSFVLPQRVIGSFDPNDKQCIEGSKLDISKIGDYLHYIIHFQNEGTDTAFNIVVTDTLSNNLDWNSFEFIGSSHTCDPVLKNNKAEFDFLNINLPYKAINEPASKGWVAFKIKPRSSVVIGDSINNTAGIYFDFNLPVITNRTTTVITSSSVPVPVKLEYFSITQKNNTNVLNWKASCTYGNASFVIERSNYALHFSAIGNISATALRCQLPFSFTDNNPVAGKNYYRIKITDADGKSFYSKILVAGNSKAGIAITAVINNTVYINSNKQQTVTVKIIAIDGKEFLNKKQSLIAGNNTIPLPLHHSSKGIYTLVVYTGEDIPITKKVIY